MTCQDSLFFALKIENKKDIEKVRKTPFFRHGIY